MEAMVAMPEAQQEELPVLPTTPAEVVDYADQFITTSSVSKREQIFVFLTETEFPNELVSEVAAVIFRTLSLYHDRASVRLTENCVSVQAKRSPSFLKAFAVKLIEKTASMTSPSAQTLVGARATLLLWSCCLVRALGPQLEPLTDSAGRASPVGKIFGAQAALLNSLSLARPKLRDSCFAAFVAALRTHQAVQASYVKLVLEPAPDAPLFAAMGAVFESLVAAKRTDLLQQHQAKFVEHYVRLVLQSNTPPSEPVHRAAAALLRTVSDQQFQSAVLPAIKLAVKRVPESVLLPIASVVANASYPLGPSAGDLGAALAPTMQSMTEALRINAAVVLVEVAKRSDEAGLQALVKSPVQLLAAKSRLPHERFGVFNGLERIASALSPAQLKAVGPNVAPTLATVLQSEASDEVKAPGLRTVGAWSAALDSLPDSAVQLYTTAVASDKEPIRSAALQSLLTAVGNFESPQKIAQVKKLLPAVQKLIVAGPKTGPDEIGALRVVAHPAIAPGAGEKWLAALKPDAPLHKLSQSGKLSEQDLIGLVALHRLLFLHHDGILQAHAPTAGVDERKTIYTSAVWTLLHGSAGARRAAISSLQSLKEDRPKIFDNLVQSLYNQLLQLTTVENPPTVTVMNAALTAVAGRHLCGESIGQLLLASHLPLVTPEFGNRGSAVWHLIAKMTGVDGHETRSTSFAAAAEYVLSPHGLYHQNKQVREAALRAVTHSLRRPGEAADAYVPGLLWQLAHGKAQLAKFSEDDIGIYNTPAGEVYKMEQEEFVARTVESVNVRKEGGRGRKGGKMGEDDGWEEHVKAEIEKKKKLEEQQIKEQQEARRKKHLEKEAAVRALVAAAVDLLRHTLEAFGRLGARPISGLYNHLSKFMPLAISLLSFAPTADQAASSIQSVASSIPPPLNAVADRVAAVIALTRPGGDSAVLSAVVDKLVARIHAIAEDNGAFDASSFAFIFPVAREALLRGTSFVAQDAALQLVEMHADESGRGFPRGDTIEVLAHLVATNQRFAERADHAVAAIASHLDVADVDPVAATEEPVSGLRQLFQALYSSSPLVRKASLEGLLRVPALRSSELPASPVRTRHLWLSQFDTEAENAPLGAQAWKLYGHPLDPDFWPMLSPLLSHVDIQAIAAASVAGAVRVYPDQLHDTLDSLYALYAAHAPEPDKPRDYLLPPMMQGPEKSKPKRDPAEDVRFRKGVGLALGAMAPVLQASELKNLFSFLLDQGLADVEETVPPVFLQAGLDIIAEQGAANSTAILDLMEQFLAKPSTSVAQDRVRQSAVILMGGVAKHLQSSAPKVQAIVDNLVATLKTPSEAVQKSVCKCLTQVMPLISDPQPLIDRLMEQLQSSTSFGERRGAAYGLAGAVKGLGIASLKKFNVMQTLQTAVEDKKHATARQGALFAFECLCAVLERLFEPYIIQILPKLLVCFGDSVNDVREATQDTARAIMSNLSAHGVKLVLPALLKALDDRNWRTKKGSIDLLGAMAFCAPRQLSSCLPAIVPRLTVVLTDTHSNVNEAAREALGHIGSVIRNPEIQLHVPLLLKALDDPDAHSREALEALIHTSFVHTIDAPSLSLIIPVLQRGLRDRATETKKKAAQIVGNMCSLTDHKDLAPYLDVVVPQLQHGLTDPSPEVRAICAKAIGSLIKGMGEDKFSGLIPWFLDTMKSDAGAVERSGAAQGLSEALAALDLSRLEGMLPSVIAHSRDHAKAHVREGYLGLFIYLPTSMGQAFEQFLPEVLPCILHGLADEAEPVREVAMRAGQSVINQYGPVSLELLLPTLEEGLFNDSWRFRASAIQLLGDLLARVLLKKQGGEPDDELMNVTLGAQRRNTILAALYIIRSDVSNVVRQKALVVWKAVVSNTPKVLREILPTLMRTLIDSLGSSNYDKRHVAGRTLGDLVQKLGEKILPEIIPILEKGLESPNADTRQGVCLGLSEVMQSSGRAQLSQYSGVLIPTVRKALCDPLVEVREAAAQAFDMLQRNVGTKALDEILPPMLADLEQPKTASLALDGLRQILTVRSNVVLPFLVPKLLTPPVTTFNVRALASIAEVAGPALVSHLSSMIPALIEALASQPGNDEMRSAAEAVVASVQPENAGVLFQEIIRHLEESAVLVAPGEVGAVQPTPKKSASKVEACNLIAVYCTSTKEGIDSLTITGVLGPLLRALLDSDVKVQEAAVAALNAVIGVIPKNDQANYISSVRSVLSHIKDYLTKASPGAVVLPGFNLPKGLTPVLLMFQQGLLLGSEGMRESAAAGLGEIIELTSDQALKPYVVQITGPLIRIISDRFSWQVKAAILSTLNILIKKGGMMVKAFLPQLQTTFIKSLHDQHRQPRVQAAAALASLMPLSAKVDALVKELVGSVSSVGASEGSAVQESILSAIQQILTTAGHQLTPETLTLIGTTLQQQLQSEEDSLRQFAGRSVGAWIRLLGPAQLDSALKSSVLNDQLEPWQVRHGSLIALTHVLANAPDIIVPSVSSERVKDVVSLVVKYSKDERVPVRQTAADAIGALLRHKPVATQLPAVRQQLLSILAELINDPQSNDVKIAALRAVKQFSKAHPEVAVEHLNLFVPILMVRVKDRASFPVKLASERALMHLLRVHSNPATAKTYCASVDSATARNVDDYVTRVLAKLQPESDDELEKE